MRSGSVPSASRPATTRACATRHAGRFELLKGLDAQKDQSYFLHRLTQAQLARTLFPLGELHEARGAPHRRRDRPAERRQEGLDRHLLHRRAAVPRVPQPLSRQRARRHRRRPRPHDRRARRPLVLHARPAQGHRHRRPEGGRRRARRRRARAVVRRAQGHRAQRPARRRRARPPVAAVASPDAADASWIAGSAPAPGRYAAKTRYRQADAACTLRPPSPATASRSPSMRRNGRSRRASRSVLYDGEVCLGGAVIAGSDAGAVPAGECARRHRLGRAAEPPGGHDKRRGWR